MAHSVAKDVEAERQAVTEITRREAFRSLFSLLGAREPAKGMCLRTDIFLHSLMINK